MPLKPQGRIFNDITETIGGTPLVRHQSRDPQGPGDRAGQVRVLQPARQRQGPHRRGDDRGGRERGGKIDPDTVIVEPTSGNTGIALAFVCAAKGYKLILTMPESMSIERRRLLKALGAEVVLTPAADGMRGAINKAEQILARHARSVHAAAVRQPRQPGNPRDTTAEEIWQDTDGKVDILVAGVGTGGTITGVAEVIKPRKPSFKAIAVEPVASPVITQTLAGEPLKPGRHKIQGIGAGFVPDNLQLNIVDEVVQVTDDEAFEWARRLAARKDCSGGISSGGNIAAAAKVAARPESKGKMIVVIPAQLRRTLSQHAAL